MRKPVLLTIVLLCTIIPLVRGESKTETLTLKFSQTDFSIVTNADGTTSIEDLSGKGYYLSSQAPGVPFFSESYAIPKGYVYKSHSLSTTQSAIKSPVTLAENPTPIPVSSQAVPIRSYVATSSVQQTSPIYPASPCKYIETSDYSKSSVLHLKFLHSTTYLTPKVCISSPR